MFKKFVTLLLIALMAFQPLVATAGADLSQAFSSLMGTGAASSSTAPGRYTAGARNIFVGGGTDIRFPRSNVTLFSVAPPSFSAGCQGISAHFGGFSFISGKQIEQLVRNIAQGAPGLVINMVIKALCPMCEAVLQNMQKLAQFAAKTNMDSCRIAANMTHMLKDTLTPTDQAGSAVVTSACSVQATSMGTASEWSQANESVCDTMKSAVSSLQKGWKALEDGVYGTGGAPGGAGTAGGGGNPTKQSTLAERCMLGTGNCSWLVLSEMFPVSDYVDGANDSIAKRLLLMNLLGTTLVGPGASCGGNATSSTAAAPVDSDSPIMTVTCLPKLDPRSVVGLFMCGNGNELGQDDLKGLTDTSIWTDYCKNMFKASNTGTDVASVRTNLADTPIMDCDSLTGATDGTRYDKCETLKASTVGTTKVISGKGFILEVQQLLQEAVRRVRANEPMGADDTGRKIITLINMAPYPLYQAINASAVYPEAGQALIDSMSILVADHLAYAYFSDFLTKSSNSSYANLTMATSMIDRLGRGMSALRLEADASKARMGKQLATQQLVMEDIRKINQVIQSTVMTDQMLNMQKYANTINTNAANPSISGK